jgi:hypothetical protein
MSADECAPTEATPSCCSTMGDAVRWGLVVYSGEGEHQLVPRPVVDLAPTATAGNILTGEAYDPGDFSLTLALVFCPWCATRLVHSAPPWCCDPKACTVPLCDCEPD